MRSIENLPKEDEGLSPDAFEILEAGREAETKKYERKIAAEVWTTPEDVYFEFPASFSNREDGARERALREIGAAQGNDGGLERLNPQAAVLHYLDNPNNRENSVFRYLTDWRIDPERRGEGIKLSFQHPPSAEDKKEIERIMRTFGWMGEEYEAKGNPAVE